MRYPLLANQEGIGASKLELVSYKTVHLLTFKRFKWIEAEIQKIKEDLEKMKSRNVY